MNKLNKLTIIIPTIGRSTLKDSCKSVPNDCNLIVSIDSKVTKFIFKLRYMGLNKVSKIYSEYESGPGFTKQAGIDHVNTEYFMILDDDDTLNPDKLNECINLLDNNEYDWLQSNGLNSNCLAPININRKSFSELLFDYDKYTPDYELVHMYTGSPGLIYRTSTFKRLGLHYKYKVMDDIIPNVKLFLNSNGVRVNAKLINYNVTENSVSRKKLSLDEISIVNKYILEEAINSNDLLEFDVWIKSLRNFVLRRIHNDRGEPLK